MNKQQIFEDLMAVAAKYGIVIEVKSIGRHGNGVPLITEPTAFSSRVIHSGDGLPMAWSGMA